MAYFHGQYGHYPQTGFGNQNYAQYNSYSTAGTSDAQANYGYSNPAASGSQQSQTSSQSYSGNTQQYNYGYSSASSSATATTTTTSQPGTTYQQFSNLWYSQVSSAQPNQTQQSTSQQQQQQGNRTSQQYTAAAYQAQMNQYYQQQSSFTQQQQQYQQGSQPSTQQYKQPSKPQQSAGTQQSQQASSTPANNQASGEWSSSTGNQQRSSEAYSTYTPQAKPSAAQSWSGYSPQQGGKDWTSQTTSYQQQQPSTGKNDYLGSGGGDYSYSQQSSTIQQQPQMYPQQQRNYPYQPPQQQQNYSSYQQGLNQRAGGTNAPDANRGYGGERSQAGSNYGPTHGNRGNWNAPSGPPNVISSGGPGEWGPGGSGGWGDWSGSRNLRRPGNDEGPHIPPFPQAWQMGPQQPPLPPGGGRMEQNRGNWSGGSNWKQGWDNQGPPKPPSNNSNRLSRGDGQQNNRFQNSGRYSPNSRQSRGSVEKPNRELWTPGDAKRGMKDKQTKSKDFQDVDKPIQATEIKSYLYAWLGVRRMRPLYDIHPVGERPDLTFRCELRVNGYKFVGVGEAASKKDAQTDAAWSFAEFLVKQGCLKKADLPAKSKTDDEATDDFGTVKEYDHQKQARPKSNRNRPPRNAPKGPIPLMSIVTSPIGNIPPFPAFERPSEAWAPPRRGPPGPWMEGTSGPWRGGHREGRGGFPQRDLEEERWMEEQREFQHPEDIFISRMIMNQQEATMAAHRLESKPGEWTSVSPARSRNVTTLDDRHVMSKHAAIYPHEEELKGVHQMVTIAERALKALSDQFVDEDHPIEKDDDDDATEEEEEEEVKKEEESQEEKKEDGEKSTEKKTKIQILKRPKKRPRSFPDTRPRVLCAVNRVGTLAKGLLIHNDLQVCLVLLCGIVPTKSLLQRIIKHLPAKLEDVNKDFKYELNEEEGGFEIVGHFEVTIKLSVALTSTSLKSSSGKEQQEKEKKKESDSEEKMEQTEEIASEEKTEEEKDPEKKPVDESEYLPKPLLLGALAKLRHAKWFQARASQQDGGVVITRILRNLKMRNPIWQPLSDWALENLLYIALSSSTEHMSPGDALRRFFEVIAGGVLLKDRNGIQDPCEKEEVDVLDCCTEQQLEDMTRHAQNSLLKIAFRKIHEVLDMEKIVLMNRQQQHPQTASSSTTAPQAQAEEEVEEREGGRKRRLEHNSSDSMAESPKRSLTDEEDTDTQQNLAELTISGPNISTVITTIEEVAEEKTTTTSEDKQETNKEEEKVRESQVEPMETDA